MDRLRFKHGPGASTAGRTHLGAGRFAVLVVAAVVALVGCRGGPARTPDPEPDRRPSFGDQTIEAQTWVVGQAVDLQLPAAAGGDPPLVYDLEPDVPGLTFDADARTWSGAPRAETPPADLSMTYRVTDADGDTAALTFAVIVWRRPYCPPPKPPFPIRDPHPPVRLRDPLSIPIAGSSCPEWPWWPWPCCTRIPL